MRAALAFLRGLDLRFVQRVRAELYGSLALTGIGHGTDRAVLLGLMGESPETVPVDCVASADRLPFSYELVFHRDQLLPGHSNGMRFSAYAADGSLLTSEVYYSIGGGFIVREGEDAAAQRDFDVPYPFKSAEDLLAYGIPIYELMMANEASLRSEQACARRRRAHLECDESARSSAASKPRAFCPADSKCAGALRVCTRRSGPAAAAIPCLVSTT